MLKCVQSQNTFHMREVLVRPHIYVICILLNNTIFFMLSYTCALYQFYKRKKHLKYTFKMLEMPVPTHLANGL